MLFTDCLHANIIREEIEHNDRTSITRVLLETFRTFPRFIRVKIFFFICALIWGYIPFIGWFVDFHYRIRWAMCSNVVVFENLSGDKARDRCKLLADKIIQAKQTGVLFAIPNILIFLFVLIFAVSITLLRTSLFLWLLYFGCLWIVLPASAAVNTILYLSIVGNKFEINAGAA